LPLKSKKFETCHLVSYPKKILTSPRLGAFAREHFPVFEDENEDEDDSDLEFASHVTRHALSAALNFYSPEDSDQ